MKPTEGTILTVVRDAAAAAAAAAATTDDIRVVLDRVVTEAHAAVERTTNQLQVLRDANVVDAGGFGLAVILEGFARAVGDTQPADSGTDGAPAVRRAGAAPASEARRHGGNGIAGGASRSSRSGPTRTGLGVLHRVPDQRPGPRRRSNPY